MKKFNISLYVQVIILLALIGPLVKYMKYYAIVPIVTVVALNAMYYWHKKSPQKFVSSFFFHPIIDFVIFILVLVTSGIVYLLTNSLAN